MAAVADVVAEVEVEVEVVMPVTLRQYPPKTSEAAAVESVAQGPEVAPPLAVCGVCSATEAAPKRSVPRGRGGREALRPPEFQ